MYLAPCMTLNVLYRSFENKWSYLVKIFYTTFMLCNCKCLATEDQEILTTPTQPTNKA